MPIRRPRPPAPSPIRRVDPQDHRITAYHAECAEKAAARSAARLVAVRAEIDEREKGLPRIYDREGNEIGVLRTVLPPIPVDPIAALTARVDALATLVQDSLTLAKKAR